MDADGSLTKEKCSSVEYNFCKNATAYSKISYLLPHAPTNSITF